MRLSTPLEFPGSRYVAGWWKQLAPLRPRALWVAHLLFHHVEALVRTSRSAEVEALTRLLLQAVQPGETLAGLADRLGVAVPLAGRLLRQLYAEGLAENHGNGRWSLTSLGVLALEQGKYIRPGHDRRLFHFVQNEAGTPPQYLALTDAQTRPCPADADWSFPVEVLRQCVTQPDGWKQQHGFPQDVEAIVDSTAAPSGMPAWRSVIVDRPGQLSAALVLAPADHGERVLGFTVNPDGWSLQAREAAFIVHSGWQQHFPDLAAEPTPEVWQAAWQAWCQRRGLPTVEANDCALERQDFRVRVRASGRLVERLRSARSEALKGEAWLLAGTGRVRMAAQLEVTSV